MASTTAIEMQKWMAAWETPQTDRWQCCLGEQQSHRTWSSRPAAIAAWLTSQHLQSLATEASVTTMLSRGRETLGVHPGQRRSFAFEHRMPIEFRCESAI